MLFAGGAGLSAVGSSSADGGAATEARFPRRRAARADERAAVSGGAVSAYVGVTRTRQGALTRVAARVVQRLSCAIDRRQGEVGRRLVVGGARRTRAVDASLSRIAIVVGLAAGATITIGAATVAIGDGREANGAARCE